MAGIPTINRPSSQTFISASAPQSAYLWTEVSAETRGKLPGDDEIFVFQYWPESLNDTYTPTYSEKTIPGGSHPLYQWTGGSGREISFTAIFTSEMAQGVEGSAIPNPFPEGLPSARYTVDVRGAVARLQSYLRGNYPEGSLNQSVKAPKKLYLVLENTRLGGDRDEVLVILKSAPIVYQAWFPNGYPRIVEASCTFAEIVQHSEGENSQIKFIGRSSFEGSAQNYRYRGTVDRVLGV